MADIYTAVKPFCFLAKTLGLFPVSLNNNRVGKSFNMILSILSCLLPAVVFYLFTFFDSGIMTSKLNVVAWNFSIQLTLIMFAGQFWFQIRKGNDMQKFIGSLKMFDVEVKPHFKS